MIRKQLAKIVGYSAVASVLFVITVGVVWLVENRRGERAWDAYRLAAQSRGAKLDFADFIPPPLPDSENFAAIPLFAEIFQRGPGFNPFELPAGSLTSSGKPKAAPLDLTDWRDRFLDTKLLPVASDDPARDVWQALQHYEPALQQLREASSRPHCRYPVAWEKGLNATMSQLGPLQGATMVLSLRIRAQLALGQSASALEDWQLGLRLYRSMEREPSLICGLVRMAQLQTLVESVRQGLATHRWSDADLRILAADLATLRVLDDYRFTLASERGFVNQEEPDPARQREGLTFILGGYGNAPYPLHVRFAARFYPLGWQRLSQLKLNAFFDAMLDRVAPTEVLVLTSSATTIADAYIADSGLDRARCAISNRCLPMFATAERIFLHGHVLILQARLGCALEAFRLQSGTFPASIDELRPHWSGDWPHDIFNGGPLRYQRTERGYRLWSIGDNRIDEGGLSDPGKSPRQQPDWIWEIP